MQTELIRRAGQVNLGDLIVVFCNDIRIPFFSIRTTLMNYSDISDTFEYSAFEIRIFKWNFTIDLYDTRSRKFRRRNNDT